MRRYFNKSNVYIFIIVLFSILYFSFNIGSEKVNKQIEDESKILSTDNVFNINITGNMESIKDVFGLLKSYDDILIKKNISLYDNGPMGYQIYFNNSNFNIPPIIEGKFFTETSFSSNKNEIVIGKELLRYTIQKDNKRYINFYGTEYIVVGIMGHANSLSYFDNTFFTKMYDENLDLFECNVYFKNDISSNKIKELIVSNTNLSVEDVNISNFENNGPISNVQFFSPLINGLMMAVILINILLASTFWVNSKSKNTNIRMICGAKHSNIIVKYIFEYILVIVISLLISLFIYFILLKFGAFDIFSILKMELYIFELLSNFIMIFCAFVIIALTQLLCINKNIDRPTIKSQVKY